MTIKTVSLKDLNEIFKLEDVVFTQNAFSRDLIKKLIKKNTYFFKLEENENEDQIIGFIIVIQDQPERANIINFLINPQYQNKGYGKTLFQSTLQKIKELNNVKKVILNVQTTNSRAINLYLRFGFKIVEKIDNYYQSKESAYLMELNTEFL
jgi:ribosomal-protein-alanine acetyltransferase